MVEQDPDQLTGSVTSPANYSYFDFICLWHYYLFTE